MGKIHLPFVLFLSYAEGMEMPVAFFLLLLKEDKQCLHPL